MARLALAQVLIFAGRPDEAVPWLDEAERLDPDNPTLSELRRQIGPNR